MTNDTPPAPAGAPDRAAGDPGGLYVQVHYPDCTSANDADCDCFAQPDSITYTLFHPDIIANPDGYAVTPNHVAPAPITHTHDTGHEHTHSNGEPFPHA